MVLKLSAANAAALIWQEYLHLLGLRILRAAMIFLQTIHLAGAVPVGPVQLVQDANSFYSDTISAFDIIFSNNTAIFSLSAQYLR